MRSSSRAGVAAVAAVLLATPGLMFASSGAPRNQSVSAGPMAERVQHELASLAYYSVFDNLSFRVEDGKVTLVGQVTQPVVKEDAERAVRRIPGVVSVANEVEVLPLSRMDDQIRRSVYYAVYAYGPLERYGMGSQPAIRIIVKGGNVTLTGVVASQMDRQMVYQRALAVRGVFSVTNHLLIEV